MHRRSNRQSGESRFSNEDRPRPLHRLVIVPVRSFTDAKSRLGSVLDADQRSRLARASATSVLTRIGFARAVVVCNDDEVVRWSRALGVPTCQVAVSGLNQSLQAAVPRIMAERQPEEIVIVHADLAFPDALTELDIVVPPGTASSVAVVPDRHHDGTNLLALGNDIVPQWRFTYGPGSCRAHCEQARALGAELRVIEHPDLGFDLDTPQDLEDHRVRAAVAAIIADRNAELNLPVPSRDQPDETR
ncbi:MAG: 2-phospho-L-lactate guanylyltransferase [Ilumatobacteraceae bacterium]